MSVAKRFEQELLKGFRHAYPDGFTTRIPDKLSVDKHGKIIRLKGSQTPADIITAHHNGIYLIECKVVNAPSIALNRLAPHQYEALYTLEHATRDGRGFIAILYYTGKPGHRGNRFEAWLVPITYWKELVDKHPRKSLNKTKLEQDLPDYKLVRKYVNHNGCWLPPKTLGEY